jgi:hypothetical protein
VGDQTSADQVADQRGQVRRAHLHAVGEVLEQLLPVGGFRDQGDAKWVVIWGRLRGHGDTPFGRPIPGRPIGRPGVGRPKGVFGGLSYY